jgi:hypothetical protein
MRERHTVVLSSRPAGAVVPQPRASGVGGSGTTTGRGSLSPRRAPAGAGGFMTSDDELLERTLAFSGSYVSDDGNVTVRRSAGGSFEYSGDRFIGYCLLCSRALLLPATGEALSDVRAAVHFVAAHSHGDVD